MYVALQKILTDRLYNQATIRRASGGGFSRSLQLQQQQLQQQRSERGALFSRTPYARTPNLHQPVYISKVIHPIAYGGVLLRPEAHELELYPHNNLESKKIDFVQNGNPGQVLQTILTAIPAMLREGRSYIMLKAKVRNSK